MILRLVQWLTGTVPTRPLAAARLLFAVAALLQARITWGVLERIASPTRVHLPMFPFSPEPSFGLYAGIIGVWTIAAVLFALGQWTRISGAVLGIAMFAAVLFDQQAYSNHQYLMAIIGFLLAMTDCGGTFSLDARRRGERAWAPLWPVLLLLAQLSIVYGFTALSKLNPVFLRGEVIQVVMPLDLMAAVSWKLMVVTSVALAVGTIVVEGALAIGMWRRAWRPMLFFVGFALHAGIATFMSAHGELTVFGLAMFAMYLPLIDAAPRSRVVVWDDTCSACAVWVRWFQRLDWFGVYDFQGSSDQAVLDRHGLTREQADQALQLFTRDGHTAGFAAVGRILESLPLTCWFAAAFRLPVVRTIGDRAYRRYAIQRSCMLPPRAAAEA
jgi:predicted DCC family thiol-disulfide oxidoreductase YuxK/uncharacterized membrane protein YphA (DoxX/SURF4 family)